MSEIAKIIREIVRSETRPELFSGVVKSVDTTNNTCAVEPVDGSAIMPDVKLRAVGDSNTSGVVIAPKVGANVIVAKIMGNYNNTVLLLTDVIETVTINSTGFKLELSSTGDLKINGGNNGGIVKVSALVQRLNALESELNNLKSILSAWVPAPGDGGAALKIAIASFLQPIQTTTSAPLENNKIQH
jgi:hypothetical protein